MALDKSPKQTPPRPFLSPEAWEWIKRTGTLVSLTGAAVGIIAFFVNQNIRIERLEARMLGATITTAVKGDGQTTPLSVNPVLQACADLAKRMADPNNALPTLNIKEAMAAMACDHVPSK